MYSVYLSEILIFSLYDLSEFVYNSFRLWQSPAIISLTCLSLLNKRPLNTSRKAGRTGYTFSGCSLCEPCSLAGFNNSGY